MRQLIDSDLLTVIGRIMRWLTDGVINDVSLTGLL